MEEQARSVRAKIFVRGLCVVVAGCGIYLIFLFAAIAVGFPKEMRQRPATGDVFVPLIFGLVLSLIGAWLLRAAWLGWRHRTARPVRGLCLASLVVAFDCGLQCVEKLHPASVRQSTPEIGWNGLWDAVAAFVAMVTYFALSRFLVGRLGLDDERSSAEQKRSVEWSLKLMTCLLGLAGVCVTTDLRLREHFNVSSAKVPWGIVTLLGPMIAAFMIYRLSAWLLTRGMPER